MKEKTVKVIACLLFITGAIIFCYPLVMNWSYDYQKEKELMTYKEDRKESIAVSENEIPFQGDMENFQNNTRKNLAQLYEDMLTYNQEIFENHQEDLNDPFCFSSSSFDLTQYGLKEELIGYLTIPTMELELPVYLGASEINLSKGVAHLGQTSMPVGGINTNVVLAGHRGYRGIPMFREIEKLTIGDQVSFTTPFDTLNYQVVSIEIIFPEEIDKIRIQPGREILTLFTCHPYRENSHRYVVYCERINLTQGETAYEENKGTQILGNGDIVKEDTEIIAELSDRENSQDMSSRRQIWLDKYVPVLGVLFLALLFFVCYKRGNRKV